MFHKLSRSDRLFLLGARIHELETRTPGSIETEKLHRTLEIFWRIIEEPFSSELDTAWVEYCEADKMKKYLKLLEA